MILGLKTKEWLKLLGVTLIGCTIGWAGVYSESWRASFVQEYCGCPNKKQCAFDNEKDCGGCCTPGPCKGGSPTCCHRRKP